MRRIHVIKTKSPYCGISIVARLMAEEDGGRLVTCDEFGGVDLTVCDEVVVHGCWLPGYWWACWRVVWWNTSRFHGSRETRGADSGGLVCGSGGLGRGSGELGRVRLFRMTHGSLDPMRLKYHGWKKRLVGPLERWALRRADVVVATCEAEGEWIRAYVGARCPRVEVTDIRRFFRLGEDEGNVRGEERERLGAVAPRAGRQGGADGQTGRVGGTLRVLYLGRRHPLKGVGYLERAVAEVNGGGLGEKRVGLDAIAPRAGRQGGADGQTGRVGERIELRIVSEHTGEELEWDWAWCDVLCLSTLSENFGLVVAEALERGKRVITTDGAPAWADWRGTGLVYLRGFREGTDGERVALLRTALVEMMRDVTGYRG